MYAKLRLRGRGFWISLYENVMERIGVTIYNVFISMFGCFVLCTSGDAFYSFL